MKVNISNHQKLMNIKSSILLVTMLYLVSVSIFANPSISYVSVSPGKANVTNNENFKFKMQINGLSKLTLEIQEEDGNVVRRISKNTSDIKQMLNLSWDGKDNNGKVLPPNMYVYIIKGKSSSGRTIKYDMRASTGGETVTVTKVKLSSKGQLSYYLSKPARVRLVLSRADSFMPITSLLDWTAQDSGAHQYKWDGWDASHAMQYSDLKNVIPIVYAYALPANSIIVASNKKAQRARMKNYRKPHSGLIDNYGNGKRSIHLHARHPRATCYHRSIGAEIYSKKDSPSYPDAKSKVISFFVNKNQQPDKAYPNSKISVFVYVDGDLKELLHNAYTPYQWIFDSSKYGKGEHVITGVFSWKDDHYGIVHKKVNIE